MLADAGCMLLLRGSLDGQLTVRDSSLSSTLLPSTPRPLFLLPSTACKNINVFLGLERPFVLICADGGLGFGLASERNAAKLGRHDFSKTSLNCESEPQVPSPLAWIPHLLCAPGLPGRTHPLLFGYFRYFPFSLGCWSFGAASHSCTVDPTLKPSPPRVFSGKEEEADCP
jgi:hypothetical protein